MKKNKLTDKYLSLSDYVSPDTIPIKKDKYIVTISGFYDRNFVTRKLSIPKKFISSLICQEIIAFCYTDYFISLATSTKVTRCQCFLTFFNFLENSPQSKVYISSLEKGGDLPFTILHEFGLHESRRGLKASTIRVLIGSVRKALDQKIQELVYKEDNSCEGLINHFKTYTDRKHLPLIKLDNIEGQVALSQLFNADQLTGETIDCPFIDSELIKSLREFCAWYLKILNKRRLFLREVKLPDGSSVMQKLTENLRNGTWSIDKPPVGGRGIFKSTDIKQSLEWSGLYAQLIVAMIPSEDELDKIKKNEATEQTLEKLLWIEPLVTSQKERLTLKLNKPNYTIDETIKRLETVVSRNIKHHTRKSGTTFHPLLLGFIKKYTYTSASSPLFSLAELLFPSPTETRLMSWLLASDCIQNSNQYKLRLSDLKYIVNGSASKIVNAENASEDDKAIGDGLFLMHNKGRSKSGGGKNWKTRSYPKSSEIRKTYESWFSLVKDSEPWVSPSFKGKWYPTNITLGPNMLTHTHLLFAALPGSLLQTAWLKHKPKEVTLKDPIIWLLKQETDQSLLGSAKLKELKALGQKISYKTISINAIRESRIVMEESNIKKLPRSFQYDAHSESMAEYYKQRGMAKERILMCIQGNRQVADKMIEEAIQFIDQSELVSVKEATKILDGDGAMPEDIIQSIENIAICTKNFTTTSIEHSKNKNQSNSLILIKDENTAWILLCYIRHIEDELNQIEANHDSKIINWLFEHAVYSILYDKFPEDIKLLADKRIDNYRLPYPPLY